jgi:FtsP/CotA-like multicopper oxidase with cupredoxin domain
VTVARNARRFTALALAAVMLLLVVGAGRAGQGRASANALGAQQQSGGAIFVPDESDGPLLQPPVIASRNGVLKADVSLIRAGIPGSNRPTLFGGLPIYSNPKDPPDQQGPLPQRHFPLAFAAGFQFTAYGKSYPAQFPAPTLQVKPGDILDLTSRDRLADEPSGPRLPPGAEIWNLHTHGAVVSPLDDSDNVYRTLLPDKPYRTRIKILNDDGSGYDWYHPHRHGYVADQVYGGLAGSMQIGDPLDPWPQFKGKFQERLLDLTAGMISTDASGRRFVDDPNPSANPEGTQPLPYGQSNIGGGPCNTPCSWRKFVNGQYNPAITIRPGETQIWTFTNLARNGNFNLGITDVNGQHPWAATILSYDGDEKNLVPNPVTLALPVPYQYDGPTVVDPGARITMAVTAPTTPGTYYLADDMTLKLRPQSQFFALATIHVTGSPVTQPAPVFPPTGRVPDLFTAKPDHVRTFDWQNITSGLPPGGPSPLAIRFAINGFEFPNGPIVTLQAGQVEQWLLVNTSPIDHTFHIHQNNFAVIAVNNQPVVTTNPFTGNPFPRRYTSLRDTVEIPPGGSVVIRFRVSPILGKYVFHCHILTHEDSGMMMAVLAIPNRAERRIALGSLPGQRSAVLVKNGNARATRRQINLHQPRNARGEVVTATGELNGDLTQDIAVGTPARPGSPAAVSVYDGKSLRRIARFVPFPESPRAGLSLAVGSVEGDGRGDIVVGRVGRGPSLVRIFRGNGTRLRTVKGAIPGILPNGVSVASADFNGDNYDDVAIGAGRGRGPLVVGLDGFTLSQRSLRPARLFAFRTDGGPTSGVNLAAGYYDPRTRPGQAANLITTTQTGRSVGQVQVWTPDPTGHQHEAGAAAFNSAWTGPRSTDSAFLLYCLHVLGASGGSQYASLASRWGVPLARASAGFPRPRHMATLYPLGRHVRTGLRLAVTFLGKQGVNALAAWTDPHKPAYISIDNHGVVSSVRTPTP